MKMYEFTQTVHEKTTIAAENEDDAWDMFRSGFFQPVSDGDGIICEEAKREPMKKYVFSQAMVEYKYVMAGSVDDAWIGLQQGHTTRMDTQYESEEIISIDDEPHKCRGY